MGEITREEIRERLGNIDQIRDIIFGAHLREYTSRLDKLESDLGTMQQEVRDRINEVKNVLSIELKSAVDSIDKRLKVISAATQEESADLRQQIDRVNRKFTNGIEALDEAVETQKNALREELTDTRDRLQEDIRELRAHVFEELDRHFSMLKEVKVSKDDMAEILFELGMRLKGTEFVPELKEAAELDYEDLALPESAPAPKRSSLGSDSATSTTAPASTPSKTPSRSTRTTKA
ncbi:hypothetical protein V2H45_00515 [Tumidithrix elongata RA019]|uniref:Chromosome partition protein Smc n=1 Tax=Tumidithrix elongata BACA0141 TaxID=2716417 RepID=A0AAW9PPT9_9CYAN|nr:hypothetical protein [Tumidithrix elongata RA019]